MIKTKQIHYAWIIMIACFIFYAALVGTCYNCRGIFYSAISSDKGWAYSSISIGSVLMGLSAVATLKVVPFFFEKFRIKWVLAITGGLYALTYVLRAFVTSILMFDILSIFMGAFSAFIIFVPLPLIIKNWFLTNKGLALGIASLASGVGAAIASPLLSAAILKWGWQKASIMNGAIAAVIAVPTIIILIEGKPEDKNMLPYGANDDYVEAMAKGKHAPIAQQHFESRLPKEEKRKMLVLCFIYSVIAQLIAGVAVQFSDYVGVLGYTLMLGGLLNSINNIGNIGGKAAGGICMDKLGAGRTTKVFIIITAAGLVSLCFGSSSTVFLYLGAFAIGLNAVCSTVVPPAMIDTFSKGDEYVEYMAKISMGTMLAAAFTSFLPVLLRDIFDSYIPVFILYIGFDVLLFIIVSIVFKERK